MHAICKLIHRNLTPRNILICQNDNWKLSGLEFALRFESTTISESASMMAHEFSQTLAPMLGKGAGSTGSALLANRPAATSTSGAGRHHLGPAGAGASGQLRRQRTLVSSAGPVGCALVAWSQLRVASCELRQARRAGGLERRLPAPHRERAAN